MSIRENVQQIIDDQQFNPGYSSLSDEHIGRHMTFVRDHEQEILKAAERIRERLYQNEMYAHNEYLVRENNVQINYNREIIYRCSQMLG